MLQSADTSILTFFGITDKITRVEAISIPTVSACISKIGETISRLPVKLYRKDEEQVTEIFDDGRIKLLNGDTGDTLSTVDMWKAAVEDFYLGRGAWIYINKNGSLVKSLHYVDSRNIGIHSNTDPIFKAFRVEVNGREYYDFNFIKLLRKTRDGYNNIPLQEEAPAVLSAAWNALKLENMMNASGGCKPGFLKSKNRLSQQAIDAIKDGYTKVYDNEEKKDKIVVLNDGIDFEAISSTAAELQMNENKKANSIEVCKLFGFPHTVIDGGATEDDNKKFVDAVIAVLNQIETELDNCLLLEAEKEQGYYWAFDTKELTRGNILERMQAYEIAKRNNILQVDEIRREEDYEPLGFNYITLGLADVLLDPATMDVFTPNTGQTKNLVSGEERADNVELRIREYIQGPDGKMKGSRNVGGGGGNPAKSVDKSGKDAIIEHKDEIIADFKSTNFNGEIHIPPRDIDVNSLSFDKMHTIEHEHDTNLKSARQYIKNAKLSYTKYVKGEEFENYIGDKGVAFVSITNNRIRTAFSKSDFNDGTKKILATINKYLK